MPLKPKGATLSKKKLGHFIEYKKNVALVSHFNTIVSF